MKEHSAAFWMMVFLACSGMWCCEPAEEVRQLILTAGAVASLHSCVHQVRNSTSYFLLFLTCVAGSRGSAFAWLHSHTSLWQPLLARL